MRFCISEIPDELEGEQMPGGFPFLRLGRLSSTFEVRRREFNYPNEANCTQHFDFNPECQLLFESCWEFFVPPLILAGLDMGYRYRASSKASAEFSIHKLAAEFERAVRFYNEPAHRNFPFVRILDSDDVELPIHFWTWVIGYYPDCNGKAASRALVINIEKFHDFLPATALDIPETELQRRFPATPNYFLPARLLPDGFLPEYL